MKTYTRCIFCKLISLMFVFHVELPCASLGCLCQAGTQSVMHARVALVVVTRVKMRLMHSTPPHCASPPPPLPLCASWLEISVKTLTPPLVFTLLHLRPPGLLTDKGQLSELDRNAQHYTAHCTAWQKYTVLHSTQHSAQLGRNAQRYTAHSTAWQKCTAS